ncbi:MAG: FeoA family protein [Gammaproteobacteria bacterium]
MSAPLTALRPGQAAVICGFATADDEANRLMTMGLVEGAEVEFLRAAPAGDPIEIRVMGYALSLRRADATGVLVDDIRDA